MNQINSDKAKRHKKSIASAFMLVEGDRIKEKLTGNTFIVSKKIDGIMQFIFFQGGEIEAYNSGGNPTPVIPCLEEMKARLTAFGASSAVIAAELYATIRENGRERVCDVSTAISNTDMHHQLKLAVFDIIELDDFVSQGRDYSERIAIINKIFAEGILVCPIESKPANSKSEVIDIFNDWVVDCGAEGLVVHSDLRLVYKIKPRHSIDAVVIGYTVGEGIENEKVRSLLFAVMRPDGSLQQIGSGSSGLSDEQRLSLYRILQKHHVLSEYITTDSRNVAYRMVEPMLVFEMSAIDFSTENSLGEPKMNMLLNYTDCDGFQSLGHTPGVRMHGITVGRLREDKSFNETDIRISQITDFCEFANVKRAELSALQPSTILSRRVFTKTAGGRTAVQKFLVWKTNKETTGRFPAYVLHHTDYCEGRKEPLARDLRISNECNQIMALAEELIEAKIKKGWIEII